MPLVYEPKVPHRCDPPLAGMVPNVCVEPMYRLGSVWECDECQAWWLVVSDNTFSRYEVYTRWYKLSPRHKRKTMKYCEKYTDKLT